MENYPILISVVVPIYNTEDYLKKCIESILCQTYKNLDIILVDDGSTDSSPEICDFYSDKDSRVMVIHKQNGGLVSARKAGAAFAKGDYILNVDGDDWIEPERIANFAARGAGTNADMIYMDGYFKDYDDRCTLNVSGISSELFYGKQIMEHIFPLMIDVGCCFQRNILGMLVCWGIKKILFQTIYNEMDNRISMGEDYACILCCLLEADSVFLMEEYGYHYVMRRNSISHNLTQNSLEGVKIWTKMARTKMKQRDCFEKLYAHLVFLEMWYIMNCNYSMLLERKRKYLYPFPKVKRGSKIAVYGAGTLGMQIVEALAPAEDYQVVLWVDKYSPCKSHFGHAIEDVSKLLDTFYDYVVIAVLDIKIVKEIEEYLLEMGIPENKTAKIEASVISEENLPLGFH